MKKAALILFITSLLTSCNQPAKETQIIISSDIDNFWQSFDKISSTNDSTLQLQYLNELFYNKASIGQKGMFKARNYTPKEYVNAINSYPKFWNSIRKNTLDNNKYNQEIRSGIKALRALYPAMKPATIYYTMGVFRSPGTGFDDLALIGSEFALGDTNTNTTEFPKNLSHIPNYYKINPTDYVDFLNIHEYIHTQQTRALDNTLSQSLYEGIADFIAQKVTKKNPPFPYYEFGNKNEELLKRAFENEMFNPIKMGDWMWNQRNQFQTRDLIYFVGARIAENYYNNTPDKKQAIKNMIELDYQNPIAFESFVNKANYFSASITTISKKFEENRPKITAIKEFKNGSKKVSPNTTNITIAFSKQMNRNMKSTGFGALGKKHFPKLLGIDFASDGLSVTYKVQLQPNKRYQILLENGYRTPDEFPIEPYLIDFTTANK